MGSTDFFSRGSSHQKGVCILLNPLCNIQIDSSFEDSEGRIVLINAFFETVFYMQCLCSKQSELAEGVY